MRESGDDELVELTTARTEFEGEAIVSALAARGIEARSLGGMLAGFRAEAPALVRVMVRAGELDRARGALREVRASSRAIDWSEAELGTADERERAPVDPEEPASVLPRWALVLLSLAGVIAVLAALPAPAPPMSVRMVMLVLAAGLAGVAWLLTSRATQEDR